MRGRAARNPTSRMDCRTVLRLSLAPRNARPLRRLAHAPVAQLDRALPSGGRGQGFESLRARQTRKPSLREGFVVWWVRGLGVEHPGFEPSPALPGETTASRSDAGPQGEPRQRRVIPSGAPEAKALPRGGLCRLVGSGTRSRTPWIRAPAPTPADRRPGVGGTGRVRRPATPAPAPTAARRAGRSRRAAIARSGRRRSARTETRRPG